MLKKYKDTGRSLSAQQLKEIRGGVGIGQGAIYCGGNDDICPFTCWTKPPDYVWAYYCAGNYCERYVCEQP